MPPEQCVHGEVTPQSDLFSLGVTFYEALSGMRPFSEGDSDATERDARYPQLVEEPQPLGDIVDLHPLLERMQIDDVEIRRAHVRTAVTSASRMPSAP